MDLPVELLSFTATAAGSDVLLQWSTAGETNNAGFEIQREAGDRSFSVIGFVPAGDPHGDRYRFVDTPPSAGTWRYRLRQIDLDGSETFSPVVAVTSGVLPAAPFLTVWPNPALDLVHVHFDGTPAGDIVLRDLLGRELRRLPATGVTTLPLDGLPAGFYRIEAATGAGRVGALLRIVR